MFNISSFLSRFSRNINAIELNKEVILEIIENKTQIKIPLEEVEIKNNVLFVKSSGAVKNKIFIFKESILEEVNKNSTLKIVDIR